MITTSRIKVICTNRNASYFSDFVCRCFIASSLASASFRTSSGNDSQWTKILIYDLLIFQIYDLLIFQIFYKKVRAERLEDEFRNIYIIRKIPLLAGAIYRGYSVFERTAWLNELTKTCRVCVWECNAVMFTREEVVETFSYWTVLVERVC